MARTPSKVIAGVLSLTLFVTQCAFAHNPEINFWAERRVSQSESPVRHSRGSGNPVVDIFQRQDKNWIPAFAGMTQSLNQFGTVRKILRPTNGKSDRLVIHIQDIHQNPEAQANIGRAVEELARTRKISAVALEGAFESIDLSGFRTFPHPELIRGAADDLLLKKRISGPIHAAVAQLENFPQLLGIDDRAHYRANVDAYRQSAGHIASLKAEQKVLARDLERRKAAVFNTELKAFDSNVLAYRTGRAPFGDYLRALSRRSDTFSTEMQIFLDALEMEYSIDFSHVEVERARLIQVLVQKLNKGDTERFLTISSAFRLGQVQHHEFYTYLRSLCERSGVPLSQYPAMNAYIQYVLLSESIDAEKIITEAASLEKNIYARLARSEEENALVAESRRLYLTGKILDFALTPEEWGEYKGVVIPAEAGIQSSNLISFERFYEEAEIRDKQMADNFLAKTGSPIKTFGDDGPAVLVTGGFHARGIDRRLQEAGYTVVSFVPKISRLRPEDSGEQATSSYLSVFTQEKTPLEKLFQGERLYLAPPIEAGPLRRMLAYFTIARGVGAHALPEPANDYRQLTGEEPPAAMHRFWQEAPSGSHASPLLNSNDVVRTALRQAPSIVFEGEISPFFLGSTGVGLELKSPQGEGKLETADVKRLTTAVALLARYLQNGGPVYAKKRLGGRTSIPFTIISDPQSTRLAYVKNGRIYLNEYIFGQTEVFIARQLNHELSPGEVHGLLEDVRFDLWCAHHGTLFQQLNYNLNELSPWNTEYIDFLKVAKTLEEPERLGLAAQFILEFSLTQQIQLALVEDYESAALIRDAFYAWLALFPDAMRKALLKKLNGINGIWSVVATNKEKDLFATKTFRARWDNLTAECQSAVAYMGIFPQALDDLSNAVLANEPTPPAARHNSPLLDSNEMYSDRERPGATEILAGDIQPKYWAGKVTGFNVDYDDREAGTKEEGELKRLTSALRILARYISSHGNGYVDRRVPPGRAIPFVLVEDDRSATLAYRRDGRIYLNRRIFKHTDAFIAHEINHELCDGEVEGLDENLGFSDWIRLEPEYTAFDKNMLKLFRTSFDYHDFVTLARSLPDPIRFRHIARFVFEFAATHLLRGVRLADFDTTVPRIYHGLRVAFSVLGADLAAEAEQKIKVMVGVADQIKGSMAEWELELREYRREFTDLLKTGLAALERSDATVELVNSLAKNIFGANGHSSPIEAPTTSERDLYRRGDNWKRAGELFRNVRTLPSLIELLKSGRTIRRSGLYHIQWAYCPPELIRLVVEELAIQKLEKESQRSRNQLRLTPQKIHRAVLSLRTADFESPIELAPGIVTTVRDLYNRSVREASDFNLPLTGRWNLLKSIGHAPTGASDLTVLRTSPDLKRLYDEGALVADDDVWELLYVHNRPFLARLVWELGAVAIKNATSQAEVDQILDSKEISTQDLEKLKRNDYEKVLPGLGRPLFSLHAFFRTHIKVNDVRTLQRWILEKLEIVPPIRARLENTYLFEDLKSFRSSGLLRNGKSIYSKLPEETLREMIHELSRIAGEEPAPKKISKLSRNLDFTAGLPGWGGIGSLYPYLKRGDLGFLTSAAALKSSLNYVARGFEVYETVKNTHPFFQKEAPFYGRLCALDIRTAFHHYPSLRRDLAKASRAADEELEKNNTEAVRLWRLALRHYWRILDTWAWMPDEFAQASRELRKQKGASPIRLETSDGMSFVLDIFDTAAAVGQGDDPQSAARFFNSDRRWSEFADVIDVNPYGLLRNLIGLAANETEESERIIEFLNDPGNRERFREFFGKGVGENGQGVARLVAGSVGTKWHPLASRLRAREDLRRLSFESPDLLLEAIFYNVSPSANIRRSIHAFVRSPSGKKFLDDCVALVKFQRRASFPTAAAAVEPTSHGSPILTHRDMLSERDTAKPVPLMDINLVPVLENGKLHFRFEHLHIAESMGIWELQQLGDALELVAKYLSDAGAEYALSRLAERSRIPLRIVLDPESPRLASLNTGVITLNQDIFTYGVPFIAKEINHELCFGEMQALQENVRFVQWISRHPQWKKELDADLLELKPLNEDYHLFLSQALERNEPDRVKLAAFFILSFSVSQLVRRITVQDFEAVRRITNSLKAVVATFPSGFGESIKKNLDALIVEAGHSIEHDFLNSASYAVIRFTIDKGLKSAAYSLNTTEDAIEKLNDLASAVFGGEEKVRPPNALPPISNLPLLWYLSKPGPQGAQIQTSLWLLLFGVLAEGSLSKFLWWCADPSSMVGTVAMMLVVAFFFAYAGVHVMIEGRIEERFGIPAPPAILSFLIHLLVFSLYSFLPLPTALPIHLAIDALLFLFYLPLLRHLEDTAFLFPATGASYKPLKDIAEKFPEVIPLVAESNRLARTYQGPDGKPLFPPDFDVLKVEWPQTRFLFGQVATWTHHRTLLEIAHKRLGRAAVYSGQSRGAIAAAAGAGAFKSLEDEFAATIENALYLAAIARHQNNLRFALVDQAKEEELARVLAIANEDFRPKTKASITNYGGKDFFTISAEQAQLSGIRALLQHAVPKASLSEVNSLDTTSHSPSFVLEDYEVKAAENRYFTYLDGLEKRLRGPRRGALLISERGKLLKTPNDIILDLKETVTHPLRPDLAGRRILTERSKVRRMIMLGNNDYLLKRLKGQYIPWPIKLAAARKTSDMITLLKPTQAPPAGIGRILGRVIALILLVILVPTVVVPAALLVKATSRGPVFFWQERVGYQGDPIHIMKLRTFTNEPEVESRRITRFGKFLRPLGIDEIPQLWLIVRGKMQWIAPRPQQRWLLSEAYIQTVLSRTLTGLISSAGKNGRVGHIRVLSGAAALAMDLKDVENASFRYNTVLFVTLAWAALRGFLITIKRSVFSPRSAVTGLLLMGNVIQAALHPGSLDPARPAPAPRISARRDESEDGPAPLPEEKAKVLSKYFLPLADRWMKEKKLSQPQRKRIESYMKGRTRKPRKGDVELLAKLVDQAVAHRLRTLFSAYQKAVYDLPFHTALSFRMMISKSILHIYRDDVQVLLAPHSDSFPMNFPLTNKLLRNFGIGLNARALITPDQFPDAASTNTYVTVTDEDGMITARPGVSTRVTLMPGEIVKFQVDSDDEGEYAEVSRLGMGIGPQMVRIYLEKGLIIKKKKVNPTPKYSEMPDGASDYDYGNLLIAWNIVPGFLGGFAVGAVLHAYGLISMNGVLMMSIASTVVAVTAHELWTYFLGWTIWVKENLVIGDNPPTVRPRFCWPWDMYWHALGTTALQSRTGSKLFLVAIRGWLSAIPFLLGLPIAAYAGAPIAPIAVAFSTIAFTNGFSRLPLQYWARSWFRQEDSAHLLFPWKTDGDLEREFGPAQAEFEQLLREHEDGLHFLTAGDVTIANAVLIGWKQSHPLFYLLYGLDQAPAQDIERWLNRLINNLPEDETVPAAFFDASRRATLMTKVAKLNGNVRADLREKIFHLELAPWPQQVRYDLLNRPDEEIPSRLYFLSRLAPEVQAKVRDDFLPEEIDDLVDHIAGMTDDFSAVQALRLLEKMNFIPSAAREIEVRKIRPNLEDREPEMEWPLHVVVKPLVETPIFWSLPFYLAGGSPVAAVPILVMFAFAFLIFHPILYRIIYKRWESPSTMLLRALPIAILYGVFALVAYGGLPFTAMSPEWDAAVITAFLHGIYNALAIRFGWPLLSLPFPIEAVQKYFQSKGLSKPAADWVNNLGPNTVLLHQSTLPDIFEGSVSQLITANESADPQVQWFASQVLLYLAHRHKKEAQSYSTKTWADQTVQFWPMDGRIVRDQPLQGETKRYRMRVRQISFTDFQIAFDAMDDTVINPKWSLPAFQVKKGSPPDSFANSQTVAQFVFRYGEAGPYSGKLKAPKSLSERLLRVQLLHAETMEGYRGRNIFGGGIRSWSMWAPTGTVLTVPDVYTPKIRQDLMENNFEDTLLGHAFNKTGFKLLEKNKTAEALFVRLKKSSAGALVALFILFFVPGCGLEGVTRTWAIESIIAVVAGLFAMLVLVVMLSGWTVSWIQTWLSTREQARREKQLRQGLRVFVQSPSEDAFAAILGAFFSQLRSEWLGRQWLERFFLDLLDVSDALPRPYREKLSEQISSFMVWDLMHRDLLFSTFRRRDAERIVSHFSGGTDETRALALRLYSRFLQNEYLNHLVRASDIRTVLRFLSPILFRNPAQVMVFPGQILANKMIGTLIQTWSVQFRPGLLLDTIATFIGFHQVDLPSRYKEGSDLATAELMTTIENAIDTLAGRFHPEFGVTLARVLHANGLRMFAEIEADRAHPEDRDMAAFERDITATHWKSERSGIESVNAMLTMNGFGHRLVDGWNDELVFKGPRTVKEKLQVGLFMAFIELPLLPGLSLLLFALAGTTDSLWAIVLGAAALPLLHVIIDLSQRRFDLVKEPWARFIIRQMVRLAVSNGIAFVSFIPILSTGELSFLNIVLALLIAEFLHAPYTAFAPPGYKLSLADTDLSRSELIELFVRSGGNFKNVSDLLGLEVEAARTLLNSENIPKSRMVNTLLRKRTKFIAAFEYYWGDDEAIAHAADTTVTEIRQWAQRFGLGELRNKWAEQKNIQPPAGTTRPKMKGLTNPVPDDTYWRDQNVRKEIEDHRSARGGLLVVTRIRPKRKRFIYVLEGTQTRVPRASLVTGPVEINWGRAPKVIQEFNLLPSELVLPKDFVGGDMRLRFNNGTVAAIVVTKKGQEYARMEIVDAGSTRTSTIYRSGKPPETVMSRIRLGREDHDLLGAQIRENRSRNHDVLVVERVPARNGFFYRVVGSEVRVPLVSLHQGRVDLVWGPAGRKVRVPSISGPRTYFTPSAHIGKQLFIHLDEGNVTALHFRGDREGDDIYIEVGEYGSSRYRRIIEPGQAATRIKKTHVNREEEGDEVGAAPSRRPSRYPLDPSRTRDERQATPPEIMFGSSKEDTQERLDLSVGEELMAIAIELVSGHVPPGQTPLTEEQRRNPEPFLRDVAQRILASDLSDHPELEGLTVEQLTKRLLNAAEAHAQKNRATENPPPSKGDGSAGPRLPLIGAITTALTALGSWFSPANAAPPALPTPPALVVEMNLKAVPSDLGLRYATETMPVAQSLRDIPDHTLMLVPLNDTRPAEENLTLAAPALQEARAHHGALHVVFVTNSAKLKSELEKLAGGATHIHFEEGGNGVVSYPTGAGPVLDLGQLDKTILRKAPYQNSFNQLRIWARDGVKLNFRGLAEDSPLRRALLDLVDIESKWVRRIEIKALADQLTKRST